MNNSTPSEIDPLNALAEEFAARQRRGERPSPAEYAARHPDLAERIRELFPALVIMEAFNPPAYDAALPRQLGECRLIREVGRGGMGIVYEAMQESLGRRVAVKVLLPTLQHGKYRERFEREARAAARLHHTNIVPVFGVGEQDGQPYYVMQFIEGRGLDAVLLDMRAAQGADALRAAATVAGEPRISGSARGSFSLSSPRIDRRNAGPTPTLPVAEGCSSTPVGQTEASYAREVARLGMQAAEALAYAHAHGVLHRDIKPSNLLLDGQGTLWIADFGLAKADDSDNLTESGDVVGTLRYLAPERFQGQGDARADVYALGVTLYELLAWRPAFDASERAILLEQISRPQVTPLRQLLPALPRDLETIVVKAMAHDLGERYATAEALAEDLRRFLEGRSILARKMGVVERLWRWSRRNPALASAVLLTVAALMSVAIVSLIFAGHVQQAAVDLADEKKLTDDALKDARTQRDLAQRRLAQQYLDHALDLCEKDQNAPHGLLWMARALETIPPGAGDLERVIRINVNAWGRIVHPLRDIHMLAEQPQTYQQRSPDRATIATWNPLQNKVHLWSLDAKIPARIVLPHETAVEAAAFSLDGKTLLTVSADGKGRLWASPSGEPLSPAFVTEKHVRHAALSPDGKIALLAPAFQRPQLWDTMHGQKFGTPLVYPSELVRAAFSPDGRLVAVEYLNREVRVWEVASQKPIGESMSHPGGLYELAFAADNRTLLTRCGDKTVFLWNALTGRPIGSPLEHPAHVSDAVFRGDGKAVLTGCHDQLARLWDVASGRLLFAPLPHSNWLWDVAFSRDGRAILTITWDGAARVWDAGTGRPLGPSVWQPEFPPRAYRLDDRTLRIAGARGVYHWELSQTAATTLQMPRGRIRGSLSRDGRDIQAFEEGKTIQFRDAVSGAPLGPPLPHSGFLMHWGLSPDAATAVLFRSQVAEFWDVASGRRVGLPIASPALVNKLLFSPDGQRLLISTLDKKARLWEIRSGRLVGAPLAHEGFIDALAFSPDGQLVLTAGQDKAVRLWQADSGHPLGPPLRHAEPIGHLAFRPDGRAFMTAAGPTLQIWDAASQEPLGPALRHSDPITNVVFSPDWRVVLTSTRAQARLWDVAEAKPLRALVGHQATITSMAIRPDGQMFLTASMDQTARLWDAPTGLPLGPPLVQPENTGIINFGLTANFTSDSRGIVSRTISGATRVWPTPTPIAGDGQRIKLWVETRTNLELEDQGIVRVLAEPEWRQRREQLNESAPP